MNELLALNRVVLVQYIEYRLAVPLLLNTLGVVRVELFDMAVAFICLKGFEQVMILLILLKIAVASGACRGQCLMVERVLVF